MAADFDQIENETADILTAISEGGQYWQIGDKQYRRGDLGTAFKILQMTAHKNAREDTNLGFGLAFFEC